MGHGKSDGTMGYVPRFALYVQGMAALIGLVRAAWPGKPRLLLGHSMRGLIATLLLIEHQRAFAAAALSGPPILTPANRRRTAPSRSEERRVGQACVSTFQSRRSPSHNTNK